MATILWIDSFSIGDDHIDNQHKKLVEIVNDFHKSLQKEDKLTVIESIIGRLYEYTKEHFNDEEELMKSLNYPELEQHQQIHQDLIQQIDSEIAIFAASKSTYPIHELGGFLKEWLVNHIIGEDKKIEPYILKQGSKK